MDNKPTPKVVPDHIIAYQEKGMFTGTRVLANGRTAKVTVNDYVNNGSLGTPPDIEEPVLVGLPIRIDQHYSEDNRARLVAPNRGRTFESVEWADSYTKGDLSNTADNGEKHIITKADVDKLPKA